MKNGKGLYIYKNLNYYDGHYNMDKRHGYGVYKYIKNNERYEGEWSNGEK